MTDDAFPGAISSKPARKKDLIFLLVLLTASLSLNVILGWKLQILKSHSSDLPDEATLSAGMTVQPLIANDLQG